MNKKYTLTLLCVSMMMSFAFAQSYYSEPKVLIAGDSWAQYMSDDGTHNEIFDKFGHSDMLLLGKSLGSNPGSGYSGNEYAISGSEAREWSDRVNYPWIDNVINEITANPSIETVILSIGGNDILAAKSGGGWYKDMDLDVAGSEAALLQTIKDDSFVIINDILAVHPNVEVLISSYDYPNFNTGFFCGFFACGKRDDLSRDSANDLITDAELNQMMITVETERISWLALEPQLYFDNAIGLSHYYYGDGSSAPGTLPLPEQSAPFSANFPGGNTSTPSIRSNFRNVADPIHLDAEAYEYKIIHQTMNYFMPKAREGVMETTFSSGGTNDGWTNGVTTSTAEVRVGDDGAGNSYKGILDFDTSGLPDDAVIEGVSLYLIRNGVGTSNPFTNLAAFGSPILDVKTGAFGTSAIEVSDYAEPADATDAGSFFGHVSSNDYALRVDLTASGLAAINKLGTTQMRLSFPNTNANADYVDFNTGDAVVDSDLLTVGLAEYMNNAKPFLDIKYTAPLSVGGFDMSDIKLYPNPVTNEFKISGLQQNQMYAVQVYTLQGQLVKTMNDYTANSSVDMSAISSGLYLVNVTSKSSSKTIKILKL